MPAGDLNPVAFAIPVFVAAIVLEAAVAKRQGREGYYYFGTALADITSGVVFQVLEVFLRFVPLLVYAWVVARWALVRPGDLGLAEDGLATFALTLLLVDFLYYWWHRASHVSNALWAVHGVHHQSEDFNLAVALRQPIFEPITWFFFYIPLALLGIPVEIFLAAYALDLFYQFFIHTELVGRLPAPLEWLLNTPSHHRVHHGVQDQYLDKNYGGILVIWDRMFGSFAPEGERVVYGTTVPVRSYNPVWTNFEHFGRMARLAGEATRLRDKLWVVVAHPAWLPAGARRDPSEPKRLEVGKYRPALSPALRRYLVAHFALLSALLLVYVLLEARFSWLTLAIVAAAIVVSCATFLGLIEDRAWARRLEPVRALAIAWAAAELASAWLDGWLPHALAAALAVIMLLSWRAQPRPRPHPPSGAHARGVDVSSAPNVEP